MTKHHRQQPPPADPSARDEQGDEFAWVSGVLAELPHEPMPAAVQLQITQALEHEQQRRELTDMPETADPDELVALRRRTNRGTFGPNAPTKLTHRALGLGRQD